MPTGSESTKANWHALRRLATIALKRLHRDNPNWNAADLREHLDLPNTKLVMALAEECGFERAESLRPHEQRSILLALLRGIHSPATVSQETGLPLAKVCDFLEEVGVPFGAGGYGMFPWPGTEKSDSQWPVVEPRHVSEKGQISYKGHVYGLGADCAGRTCWVEEAGDRLIVHFSDRPRAALHRIG